MGRFNFKNYESFIQSNSESPMVESREIDMDMKDRVIMLVLKSFISERENFYYYPSGLDQEVKQFIRENPRFIAKLVVYAREKLRLRRIALILTCELAQVPEGKAYVREVMNKIIRRPDDMTEIIDYTLTLYGKPIPNAIKKGIRDTFLRFHENDLSKYDGNRFVKMRDLILLTHLKGRKNKENELIKKILHGKLGKQIIGENHLLENKGTPFSYYDQYKRLKNEGTCDPKTYEALEEDLIKSIENMPKFKGRTLIACDVSESMGERFPIYGMELTSGDIGRVLISIAGEICEEALLRTFNHRLNKNPLVNKGGIIEGAESIKIESGKSNISLPFYELINDKIHVDRIIILSDYKGRIGSGQWRRYVDRYRQKVNPEVWVHGIDCAGYDMQEFYGDKTNIIHSWDDKIFRFIYQVENGIEKIRAEIEKYYY